MSAVRKVSGGGWLVSQVAAESGLSAVDVAALMMTAAGRRALSRASLIFFDTWYCGMSAAPFRERWLDTFQDAVGRAQRQRTKERLLVLAPRDHGKSEAVVTLAAWRICLDRNVRILMVSENLEQSEARMKRVVQLLGSERIQADWCSAPQEGYGPFWKGKAPSSNILTVQRAANWIDPTLKAIGYGSALTGMHPDLILFDDIQSAEAANSPTERRKLREFVDGTVSPMLSRGGCWVVIGTRKHADDVYGYLMSKPTWGVVWDKAFVRMPDPSTYQMETRYNAELDREELVSLTLLPSFDGQVLWPARFAGDPLCRDAAYLLTEMVNMGERAFKREMQNDILDDSSAPVAWRHLLASLERGAGLSMLERPSRAFLKDKVVVQAWDFSLIDDPEAAEARDGDYTVGVTVALCPRTGRRFLLDMVRERGLTDAQIQAAIVDAFNKWGGEAEGVVREVVLERNSFGQLHFKQLRRNTALPLRGHYTGKNKTSAWEGVPSLAPLFENGKWSLASADPYSAALSRVLMTELYGLGKEKHDDTVMALWIANTRLAKVSARRRTSDGKDAMERVRAKTLGAPTEAGSGEIQHNVSDAKQMTPQEQSLALFWSKQPGQKRRALRRG